MAANNMEDLRRARVNADQKLHQLEKQLISCNNKLEHEIKSNEINSKKLEETSHLLEEKTNKLLEVETTKQNIEGNLTRLTKINENLEAEKLNLLSSIERKNKEIDRLNGEWKSMFEKISNANSLQYEAKAKLDELQSKETSYQLREKRLEQEKELLVKQNTWLDAQFKEKSEAFFSLKKEQSSIVRNLQSQLDGKSEEVKNLEMTTKNMKEMISELESKANSFMENLKDARELQSKTEEQYKLEVAAQNKLTTLYKDSAEESKEKCNELLGAVEELQSLLKQSKSDCLDTESKLKESEENYTKSVQEYDIKVQNLENELKNANDLLEAARQRGTAPMSSESLAAFSPTAAATSSFLKSGMTLTQIYNHYVDTLDSLQVEKAENTRLKEYMDDIVKEIEEKAPLLQQQKKDYESALDTVDKLTEKLEYAMSECERFGNESGEAVRKAEHLKRENDRMKILADDLGNQVKVLLKECQEARGGVVTNDYNHTSHDEVSSSSDVISEHLVTFRNIGELQEQNQKLLTAIRELSEEKEGQEEIDASNASHTDLQNQLDTALSELEELKVARSRQVQMVEAVVRQRDMYKVLLSNTGQSPISSQILHESLSTSPMSASFKEQDQKSFEEDTGKALQELQKQFESYKNKRLENEKVLQEKNDEMTTKLSEVTIKNAKISSQLEHADERYKLLTASSDGFKREAEVLREKSQKLSVSLGKVETSYEVTKQELLEVKEKLAKTEVMCENAKQERNVLKEAEARLMEINKSLIDQQRGQNTLLTNLQTIQNNLERQEYETKTHLTSQIEGLERELAVLKQKHNSEADNHTKVVEQLQVQARRSKQEVENEIEKNKEAKTEIDNLNQQLEELKRKLSETQSHLSASETRLNEILTRNSEDPDAGVSILLKEQEERLTSIIDEMKTKLQQTESRNQIVEGQLNLANQHSKQYKAMLAANEDALAEINKTSKLYQEKTEVEQRAAKRFKDTIEAELSEMKEKNRILEDKNRVLRDKIEQETTSLRQNVQKLTSDLDKAKQESENATSSEKRMKEMCEEQKLLATQAREKYEQELVNHASDVKALSEAKEQLQTFNTRMEETESKLKSTVDELSESKNSWEEQRKIQNEEVQKLVSRCEELVKQNTLLHEQGEKLSQQVLTAQSSKESRLAAVSEATEDQVQESKTVKDLWEVIRFIRKEKDIAETKNELTCSENIRYKQRLEYVEKQLDESEKLLAKERERMSISMKDSKEHDEIMEKVEKLGKVEELNKVLVGEKESLQKKLNDSNANVKKLEDQLTPMRQSVKSLTAQKDMLVGEKTGLKNEIQRWRTRTNKLIEQCKQQADPEELKRLQVEKKQFLTQQKILKDESQKSKVQIEAMKNEITRLQADINNKKNEITKIQEELNTMKSENTTAAGKITEDFEKLQKDFEAKNEEINEKMKTISQLKKIARRYKNQHDELVKEKAELDKKLAEEKPAETDSGKHTELENTIKTLNEEKKALLEEKEKLNQEFTATKEKEEKTKKTLNSATKKIQQLMSLKDKYLGESEELKKSLEEIRQEKEAMMQLANEREMRLNVLSTQLEGKQTRLDKELQEKNEQLEKYNKEKAAILEREAANKNETEKLKRKVLHVQRLLYKAQNQTGQSGSTSTVGSTEHSEHVNNQPSNIVPPTAAIKPTATPSTSVAVRSVSTPTASIRPMALTTVPVPSTPTATVPPTVTTQQTGVAHVSAVNQVVTSRLVELLPQSSTTAVAAPTSAPEVTSSPSLPVRPITSSSVSTVIAMATPNVSEEKPTDARTSGEERPATETIVTQEQQQSTVTAEGTSLGAGNKRSRDHESTSESVSDVNRKKARTEEEEILVDDEAVLESGVGDETEEETGEPEVVLIDDESDDDDDQITKEEDKELSDDVDDDECVEVIEDDDEEDDEEDDQMDIKDEFEDDTNPDENSTTQQEISNTPVVRLTADTTPSTSEQNRRSQEEATMTSQTPSMAQIRLIRTQSHLAPFTLTQSQPGSTGFDDTDDCMVPSTPTLFIPKPSDGFSEMISSPRVHHPFSFGPSAETVLNQTGGLAMGMTEEGLRVDDTRFDIMQVSGDTEDQDIGFDNVVPDLDEAATISFQSTVERGDSSAGTSTVLSTSKTKQSNNQTVDISEQNVPETSEKCDIEPGELLLEDDEDDEDEEGTKVVIRDEFENNEQSVEEKIESRLEEDDDGVLDVKSSEETSPDNPRETDSTSDVPSTSKTDNPSQQETRSKPNVVQLRRPASQVTMDTTIPRIQAQGVVGQTTRRFIRRHQGRGQPRITSRGSQRRGRGGAPTNL